MPHGVLIDCVLMQTDIVGFMKPKKDVPEEFLHFYRSDRYIDFNKVEYIPITGQIASPAIDGQSLVGISLEVHGQERYPLYYGIAQYNNPALRIHGRFASEMGIHQAIVPLHPGREMTLVYKMNIDFDAFTLKTGTSVPPRDPTFWMKADDTEAKLRMQAGMKAGKQYVIAPPY